MNTQRITIGVDLTKVLFTAMITFLIGSFFLMIYKVVADNKKNQRIS